MGLCLRIAIATRPPAAAAPSNSSMRSPGASSTIAFFHARVRPAVQPRRLGFDFIFIVRTSITRTSKISSTAARICGLVRVGVDPERVLVVRDQRVALLRDHGAADHADARPLAASYAALSRAARPRAATSASSSSAASESDQRCARRRRRRRRPSRAGSTTTRAMLRNDFAQRDLVVAEQHQHLAAAVEGLERLCGRARRGLVVGGGVDDRDAAAAGVHAERRAQRAPARLAVDLHGVAARAWGRRPRRRRSSAACGSSRRGRGRCPSGATASRRRPCTSPRVRVDGRAAPAGELLGAHRLVDDARCGTARRRSRPAA